MYKYFSYETGGPMSDSFYVLLHMYKEQFYVLHSYVYT